VTLCSVKSFRVQTFKGRSHRVRHNTHFNLLRYAKRDAYPKLTGYDLPIL
jgi:hypothetical protein